MAWVQTGSFVSTESDSTVISTPGDPKGIVFWGTGNTNNDTNHNDATMFVGFSDGSNDVAWMHNSRNGQDDQLRWGVSDASVFQVNADTDSERLRGTAAMNSSDVTISYSTQEADLIVHYMAFGGSDCAAVAGSAEVTGAPITGIGFSSDLIFTGTHGSDFDSSSQHSFFAFGACNASLDQWGLLAYMDDNASTVRGAAVVDGICMGQYDLDYTNWTDAISSIGSDGFDLSSGTNADQFAYLCLDLGGLAVDIGTFTKSTGTAPATQALPTLSATPQAYMLACAAATDQDIDVERDVCVAIGAVDADSQHSAIETAVDGSQVCRERTNTGAVLQISTDLDGNGVESEGDAQSLSDTTPEIVWDPNSSDAFHIGYVAIEAEAGADPEARLVGGKLLRGGLLGAGALVG